MRFFIEGSPTPFATKAEAAWKECLRQGIPPNQGIQNWQGVVLTFHLDSFTRNNQPFDIDNLVEPIFSVLVGEKKYFGGRRPNIRWWYAKRLQTKPSGVDIELSTEYPYRGTLRASIPPQKGSDLAIRVAKITSTGYKVIFDSVYSGLLPQSATSPEIPLWLKGMNLNTLGQDRAFLYLCFSQEINIADISTGKVKHVIDCLYPILGGQPGNPEDWKIDELFVEKI